MSRTLSTRAIKRITNEIKDMNQSKSILEESGIYVNYDESDISKLYVMMVGPSDTPYEDGYFFFQFIFPENYPMNPPIATYFTQGPMYDEKTKRYELVRFNPNLYTCGKVCLSMLNTWEGPGWVPSNTMTNVFMAIQGLVLTNNPLENEPGYENMEGTEKAQYEVYNEMIRFAKYKIGILGMIRNPPKGFEMFLPIMIEKYQKNLDKYLCQMDDLSRRISKDSLYIMPHFGLSSRLNYESLMKEFHEATF